MVADGRISGRLRSLSGTVGQHQRGSARNTAQAGSYRLQVTTSDGAVRGL